MWWLVDLADRTWNDLRMDNSDYRSPITLSEYNFADKLVQNTAVYASITFE